MIKGQCRGCGRDLEFGDDYNVCNQCGYLKWKDKRWDRVWEIAWSETDGFFEAYMELKGLYGDIIKFGR